MFFLLFGSVMAVIWHTLPILRQIVTPSELFKRDYLSQTTAGENGAFPLPLRAWFSGHFFEFPVTLLFEALTCHFTFPSIMNLTKKRFEKKPY